MAILQSIGQSVAGANVQTRFTVTLDSATSLINSRAAWELLDLEGFVWNSGDCGRIDSEISQTNPNEVQVAADSDIALPSNLIANGNGSRYQIRYTLYLEGAQPVHVFDQFTVLPPVAPQYGGVDQVEMITPNEVNIKLILPNKVSATNITCQLQINNITVAKSSTISEGVPTQTGYCYTATFPAPKADPRVIVNLEPYTVIWTYPDSDNNVLYETSRLFMVNTSILDVVREVQSFINRAYTDGGIQPGTTFRTADVMEYLRVGRDQFNAQATPTNFTMTNARGAFRWFWVMYSSAAACRAQYLAEGMKAFNYSGQEVQLDIDRTQYWDTMAQNLEQQAADQVHNFKMALAKRGNISGDGSSTAVQANGVGAIGITIHAASPLRGSYYGLFGSLGLLPYMGW